MMLGRAAGETRLVILVVAISLALSGLTVWAVVEQGRTLQAREWADLVSAASGAAAQREAALKAELQRAFDAAGRAWQVGGADDLDMWAACQRNWLLTLVQPGEGGWSVFPRTPLENVLPTSAPAVAARGPVEEGETALDSTGGHDLAATLDYFKRLATSPDPLTRAGALLGSATYEQQLGHPLAAARILSDAANWLRATPGLARFAFRAELGRIDSLLAAGDRERAHEALVTFLTGMLADHPARLGEAEIARLEHQAKGLAATRDEALRTALAELETRARRRELVARVAVELCEREPLAASAPVDQLTFHVGASATNDPVVVARREISPEARLALVAPVRDLLARYWEPTEPAAPWQVVGPRSEAAATPLVALGPEFGQCVLVPAQAAAARMQALARRWLGIAFATAAGSAGAWALVIWMMIRVVARQRELAQLQGRFVADISHELKTPLALIRLLAETLAEGRVRDVERIRDYHETITRESERLTGLLENILDLGRIESGRKQYQFAPCAVDDVVRQAWSLFEPQFAREGFETRLEIAEPLPLVRADPAALQQVLVNLLQNAHRYGRSGKYVRLAVAREGFVIIITVEDHGIGMNRDQVARLGESFFRADDTRVRQTRGAGLGLAIAHHIVTAHGGKIDVHSRPGQGSTFTVWIPCDTGEQD